MTLTSYWIIQVMDTLKSGWNTTLSIITLVVGSIMLGWQSINYWELGSPLPLSSPSGRSMTEQELIKNLLKLSDGMWNKARYVEHGQRIQIKQNYDLASSSAYSLEESAKALDRVIALYLISTKIGMDVPHRITTMMKEEYLRQKTQIEWELRTFVM